MRETTGPALFYWGLSSQGHGQTLSHPQRTHKAVHLAGPNRGSVWSGEGRELHQPRPLLGGSEGTVREKDSWLQENKN